MAADATQLGTLLRENRSLRYLDISNNAIGDVGCASLCEALAEHRGEGLQALVMWNTALTAEAAPHIANVLVSTHCHFSLLKQLKFNLISIANFSAYLLTSFY